MDNSPEELRDLSDSGAPVKSRVSDPIHARSLIDDLIDGDKERARRRTLVAGLLDGNAPVSDRSLRKDGRAGDANINWREANGQLTNAWTPYFDLRGEVPVCIDGNLDAADPATDAELMRGFAEAFHKMLFGWAGFDRVTQLCDKTMLVHGMGNKIWDDEWDWRPKTCLVDDLIVPDDTFSDLSNCEEVLVRSVWSAGKLWRMIENERQAKAAGWNPEAVKKAIMMSSKDSNDLSANHGWERWQRSFRNGDLYVSQKQTKQIPIHTLLVQEMDGSISQHLICGDDSGKNTEYLYSKVSRYEGWEQCVCAFPYDIGSDGTWYSIKGLGTELYPFGHLSNRVLNNLADLMIVGIKPWFVQKSGGDVQRIQLKKLAGFNIMPSNYEPLTVSISGNIAPALEVSREFKAILGANTGTFQGQDLQAPTVEETAKSATIRAMDRAKLTKGAHNRYYRSCDREYAEIWRRAVNPKLRAYHPGGREALKFQEECRELCDAFDVPHSTLQKVTNVRATRSLGLGNPAMRIEISNAIMQQYPLLDPVGQNAALRMYLAALTSYHNVDSLVPSISTGQMPVNDDSDAAAENNAINALGPEAELVITPRQQHEIHLNHHIGSMERDAQACQEGQQEPRQCFARLEIKGTHSQQHLAELSKNPMKNDKAQEFGQRMQQLAAFSDQLQQNIEEEDAANEQEDPENPSPEMTKVVGQLQLKSQKQQGDMALKAAKQQQNQQLTIAKTASDIRIKDLQTAADIRRKNAMAISTASQKKANDDEE